MYYFNHASKHSNKLHLVEHIAKFRVFKLWFSFTLWNKFLVEIVHTVGGDCWFFQRTSFNWYSIFQNKKTYFFLGSFKADGRALKGVSFIFILKFYQGYVCILTNYTEGFLRKSNHTTNIFFPIFNLQGHFFLTFSVFILL